MDKLAVADVQAHMGDHGAVPGEEQNVRRLKLCLGDRHAVIQLILGAAVQGVAKLLVHIGCKARAVEGVGTGGGVNIGIALKLQGVVYNPLGQLPVKVSGGEDGAAAVVFLVQIGGGLYHHIIGVDITGAAVAGDLIPAVGFAGDGEGEPVGHGAQNRVAGAGTLADPQAVTVGADIGVDHLCGVHSGDGGAGLAAVFVLIDHLKAALGLVGVHSHRAFGAGDCIDGRGGGRCLPDPNGSGGVHPGRGRQSGHGQQGGCQQGGCQDAGDKMGIFHRIPPGNQGMLSGGQGALQPDRGDVDGGVQAVLFTALHHAVPALQVGGGELELDADPGGHVHVAGGLGVQNLQLDDVGVGHVAVIDDVVFPAQGPAFIGERDLFVCHSNLHT